MTGNGDENVIDSLINQAPMVVADIIALTTGGDKASADDYKKMVDVAGNLPIGDQYAILEKVWNVSFPQGPKSFSTASGPHSGSSPARLDGLRLRDRQSSRQMRPLRT
jgi:hypothetical protein